MQHQSWLHTRPLATSPVTSLCLAQKFMAAGPISDCVSTTHPLCLPYVHGVKPWHTDSCTARVSCIASSFMWFTIAVPKPRPHTPAFCLTTIITTSTINQLLLVMNTRKVEPPNTSASALRAHECVHEGQSATKDYLSWSLRACVVR